MPVVRKPSPFCGGFRPASAQTTHRSPSSSYSTSKSQRMPRPSKNKVHLRDLARRKRGRHHFPLNLSQLLATALLKAGHLSLLLVLVLALAQVYSEEFHSDSDDALGIEELEGEVVQLSEHIPGNLETDSDPELKNEQQPGTFAAPQAGNPTGTSKWYTGKYPLHRRPLLCLQADLKAVGVSMRLGSATRSWLRPARQLCAAFHPPGHRTPSPAPLVRPLV